MGDRFYGAATRVPARGGHSSSSAPATSAPRSPSARSPRARTSRSPTTGTRPSASRSTALEARGARVRDRRHPRPRATSTRCSPTRPDRVVCCSPRRPAGRCRPTRARLHRGDEPHRRAPRRRGGRATPARPPRRLRLARCTSTARGLTGEVGADHPYGPQGDLAHLSKIYAELCLRMHAERHGFDARAPAARASSTARARSSTTGPSRRPSSTSSAASPRPGEPLPLDGGGRATIGVVHVDDAARILLDAAPTGVEAPTSRPRRSPSPTSPRSPRAASRRGGAGVDVRHAVHATSTRVAELPARAMRLLVTGATGYLGWRTATLLRERGHDVVALARPGAAPRAPRRAASTPSRSTPATPRRASSSPAATRSCTSPACPTPRARARTPRRAVRENAGTTLNLLEGCAEHGAGARLPLDRARRARAAARPLRALQAPRRGGLPAAPRARATVAAADVASSAPARSPGRARPARSPRSPRARSTGAPIAIPGDPRRTRDFLYVDDLVDGHRARSSPTARWRRVALAPAAASPRRCWTPRGWSRSRPRARTSRSSCPAASCRPARTRATRLTAGRRTASIDRRGRSTEAVAAYVDWLRLHPAAQGRARA